MKFSEHIERLLETRDDELPRTGGVNAIIAVGIDVSKDGWSASQQSKDVASRASHLYLNRVSNHLIFSGGYRTKALTEAELMYEAVKYYVPDPASNYTTDGHTFVETESTRTWMNADESLKIMKAHGWTSAIVVAQQWHARRVRATFRKRWGPGYAIYVVKARSAYTGDNSQGRLRSFWRFAIWDTLAFIVSYLKGYC